MYEVQEGIQRHWTILLPYSASQPLPPRLLACIKDNETERRGWGDLFGVPGQENELDSGDLCSKQGQERTANLSEQREKVVTSWGWGA